jgi:hypothetical protein
MMTISIFFFQISYDMRFPDLAFDICLCKLTSDSTWNEQGGVNISEEVCWIGLNLSYLEASTSVGTVAENASYERTCQAACRSSNIVITNWVWEGDSWWSSSTFFGLVDVSSGTGR